MRWYQRVIAIAVLSMSTVAAGVGASYGQDKTVRIGYQKYGKLVLLKGKGSLEEKLRPFGYKVSWTEFPSGPPLLEALNVGAIDFGVAGETPPIFAQAAGAPLVYLAYDPPAPQGEAILVPKDSTLKSVAELRGKKVALNKGSNVHYLLVKALEKAGLKYTDVQPVFLAPSDALAAFSRGSVDAWVIWDPYEAAAEASTGARVLADGTDVVANYQFYFTSKDFLSHDPPFSLGCDDSRADTRQLAFQRAVCVVLVSKAALQSAAAAGDLRGVQGRLLDLCHLHRDGWHGR